MKINIITSCPEYFGSNLHTSILGRAVEQGRVEFTIVNLRDFADGERKKIVDDTPYGGGPGMVLKVEPIVRALDALEKRGERGRVYLTSARGEVFTQAHARAFAREPIITLICGHYEGVDERVTHFIDGQLSLGQFVLTGGEPAAAVIADSVVRLLPGVLGNQESLSEESFDENELEYPQYTRPAVYRGLEVPAVLLSGNHGEIATWRREQRLPVNTSDSTSVSQILKSLL